MDTELIWQQYGLEQLEEGIRNLFPGGGFSLRELLDALWSGDLLQAAKLIFAHSGTVIATADSMRRVLVWILAVGVMSSLMTHFVEVFDRNQVADLSFYFSYLLLVTVLLKTFYETAQIATETIDQVLVFHRTLIPTYLLTVGVSCGPTTQFAYSQLLLILMTAVEEGMRKLVLPAIYGYCMLAVAGGIWKEEKLTLLMELIRKMLVWLLKGALGLVTGISAFQSVIAPVVDSVKATGFERIVSMLPGAGNLADGLLELLAGSALMIKNSVGVLLLLLLLALCIRPLLRMCMMALALKVAAAVLGMVADKRMTTCVDSMGNAGLLLTGAAGCVVLLFFIALAVVAVGTRL